MDFEPRHREFVCKGCGTSERGQYVPVGWYSIARHTSDPKRPRWRLGLFCSAICIELSVGPMQREEARFGTGWQRQAMKVQAGREGHSAGNLKRPSRTRVGE